MGTTRGKDKKIYIYFDLGGNRTQSDKSDITEETAKVEDYCKENNRIQKGLIRIIDICYLSRHAELWKVFHSAQTDSRRPN